VDTELQVLAERLVELGEVVLVLSNLSEDVHALLDDVLADNLEDLVLLKRLTGDVERRSSESTIPLTKLRYSGMMSSQSSMMKTRQNVKLDVVALLLGLEEVERCTEKRI
jgi:hypothetical protein